MRSRPEIELKVPPVVHPGDSVTATITLRSLSETPVDFIEIRLTGDESIYTPENNSTVERRVLSETVSLATALNLTEGTHRFEGTFTLPADVACSYVGYASEIRYAVRVLVAIPWWLDAEESHDLPVKPRPERRPEPLPVSGASQETGQPFVEITLDDRAFAPGDEITGAIALGNVRNRRIRGLDLSIVGTEHLRFESGRVIAEARRHTVFHRADPEDEGREIPFRVRIPADAHPTFDAGLMALTWSFEVRADLWHTSVVGAVPVLIGPFTGRPLTTGQRRHVGSERWRHAWADVGARAGLSLDPLDLRLRGLLHGREVTISIDTETTGDAGKLCAEIRWESWGLGLRVSPARLAFGSGDEFRRYRVEGRDPSQIEALVTEPLKRALLAFDDIRMDDEHVTARVVAPAHHEAALTAFVARVSDLTQALHEADPRIPPPAPMIPVLPEWTALAEELGGRLALGSMSIRGGILDGGVFDITTHFEESVEPSLTRVTLRADPPLPRPFDPTIPGAFAAAPPGTREIVDDILKLASALRAVPQSIEIDCPSPLAPPSRLLTPMRAMLALAHRLSGERHVGPYR